MDKTRLQELAGIQEKFEDLHFDELIQEMEAQYRNLEALKPYAIKGGFTVNDVLKNGRAIAATARDLAQAADRALDVLKRQE